MFSRTMNRSRMPYVRRHSMFSHNVPSSHVPNFKGKELHHETLEIRKRLLDALTQEQSLGSMFNAWFNKRPIKSSLFDFRKYLTQDQVKFVNLLDESCYQLILEEHLPILEKFYKAKQQEHTFLGNLYRKITFEEMICRLIKARYEAAYQDGRLLCYRDGHHELIEPLRHLSDRDKLLAVGTPEDKSKLYEHYLTMEESALSHLVSANGYFLPIENGVRYRNNGVVPHYRSGNALHELEQAHLGPVLINYAVGPELRNGQSLHYDALMCLEYADEKPGHPHYDRRTKALNHHGFASVAQDLYGDEYPQGPKPKEACQLIKFKLPQGEYGFKEANFYVNAYKTRLRHTLKQTLMASDLLMPEPGVIRLKGLGLGAFGISSLESILESLYLEVLNELLSTLPLKKINKVELINFPSLMKRFDMHPDDLDYYMNYGKDMSYPAQIEHPRIKVVQKLTPCLSNAEEAYLATQICGDSISRPGNEGAIGLPPHSSDEASMYYSLAGMNSMREQTNVPNEELVGKIIVTDGVHCTKLVDKLEGELSPSSNSSINPSPI
ncbi:MULTISPECIES: hypothetical protein [Legionella]|uniref:Uncharacterized protein n=1 Tax=Legionella resiliens TaxID=2905958 RepID=A0ABS8X247_9GAMM|nr:MULTISPECIES: hypothetical protein [unclassified Legionella]MCE0721994.1 hypothetical protein [Legionella sp. 9fVS26]MCE3531148.1 hypothetical protein [Legionella sp. 8cVS16]QLZ70736.1 hypothetical protein FOLKNPGA_03553 [Legionella sp. PC1000]